MGWCIYDDYRTCANVLYQIVLYTAGRAHNLLYQIVPYMADRAHTVLYQIVAYIIYCNNTHYCFTYSLFFFLRFFLSKETVSHVG